VAGPVLVIKSFIFKKTRLKHFFSLLLISAIHYSAIAQSKYWQQEVHYTIDVTLNDNDHTLDGFLKLQYINHSPDTLSYIWFHLWPNAYKNDKTAFSEQLLLNGRTDFYFANKEKRGYINRLDFRINNGTLRMQDHPQFIDVVQVFLPSPLAPGEQTTITTPFHVKLPANFSRGGHTGKSYQITQWYPKPAVYDRKGWHPMPYLDQGEFYSEFGSFDVRLSLPESYTVAATGVLQNGDWMGKNDSKTETPVVKKKPAFPAKLPPKKATVKKPVTKTQPPIVQRANTPLKTLQYKQDRIHDFAWFASKDFIVKEDTLQLASGRVVKAYSFYRSKKDKGWENSISYIKDAVRFRSQHIGEYPYEVVSVVEATLGFTGGMEYPTITSISPMEDAKTLDIVIQHEIGHNWFYGILASNERDHPWLDEGLNSYYDRRYTAWKYPNNDTTGFIGKRMPADPAILILDALAKKKEDQPVNTPSSSFTSINYGLVSYGKTAAWLEDIEQSIGKEKFDAAMQAYYRQWQFKHPYPEDFQNVLEQQSGTDLDASFAALDKKGPVNADKPTQKIKPAFLFSFKDYDRYNYIGWTPVPGYNKYDGFMIGLLLHNYNLPANKFQFVLAPMYATNSKQFNGIGKMSYTWMPSKLFKQVEVGANFARFSTMSDVDSNQNKIFGGFAKIAPSLRLTFKNKRQQGSVEKWIEWKTFFIRETEFADYKQDSDDSAYYPTGTESFNRYVNQLTFSLTDYRKLYPYDLQLQVVQGDGFYRATAEGHYFFNYEKGGGMQLRAFAAKFGYFGGKEPSFDTYRYMPKLTAVRGEDDYTYSNYFFGRNEFDGFASQQIMMRDAGLKIRTDLFDDLPNRSDNWVAALNFATTLPEKLFPLKLPVRFFLDVGTSSDAWKKDAETSRFLYVGGLQLSLFKDVVHFYAPIIYSKEFKDRLKSVDDLNKFFKRLSFSIDIHRFNLRKIIGNQVPALW
jgi:hypothetical protein